MASTDNLDTIYRKHENILDLIPVVRRREFSILTQPAKSLKSFSLFRRGCDERYISFVVMGVLEALEYIHGHEKLVHGNINLNNVFLDKDCNAKLKSPLTKSCEIKDQKTDIQMVGELALSLFNGKSGFKFGIGCVSGCTRKKDDGFEVEDFARFCLNPLRTPTLREVKNHDFFKEFGKFDQYREKLKHRLQKKL
ncbi:hypothetical protein POM88_042597 [Heracleum sosnowskyi]|uniref:Protein kinase domain-containing protein n=1 Tax=Heracleum sosnowskyi TaxID=360622 RepID=A0AAD8MAT0_9APIA|nr:hypothetical protein POM88_042597 [Heracleum sosnowskyi]